MQMYLLFFANFHQEDLARGKPDLQGPQEPWTDTESSLSETDSEEDEDHRERKQGKRHTDEEDSSEYSGSESPSGSESYTDSYTDTESYSESESDTDEGQQRPRAGCVYHFPLRRFCANTASFQQREAKTWHR